MQASNLFERTVKCLARTARMGDPTAGGPDNALLKGAAVACVSAVVQALDVWARPLQDAAAAYDAGDAAPAAPSPGAA